MEIDIIVGREFCYEKWFALLLVFLLAMMSVAVAAEMDFSSYMEAELRELRTQINYGL